MKIIITILTLSLTLLGCLPTGKKIENKITMSNNDKLSFDLSPYFKKVQLSEVLVGDLNLPSGKIVAGDPFFIYNQPAFDKSVTPGKYPVSILIAKIEEDHYRVAFAKISFRKEKAVRWQLALTPNITPTEIDSLKPGDFFGYGVDAGLGCFTDVTTNEIFNQEMDNHYKASPQGNYYTDILEEEFKRTSGNHPLSRVNGDWNNHFLRTKPELNVIMFSSGWGDGYYPTYWGYNDKGELVELITDFLVLAEDQ